MLRLYNHILFIWLDEVILCWISKFYEINLSYWMCNKVGLQVYYKEEKRGFWDSNSLGPLLCFKHKRKSSKMT